MTASDTYMRSATGRAGYFDGRQPFALEERDWGYVIRSNEDPSVWAVAGQFGAWAGGIGAALAAAAQWMLPAAAQSLLPAALVGAPLPRLALSLALLLGAAVLLWFASRGLRPEVEVDTARREVRQMVRNRAGRPTLVARHDFETIGGVVLDRGARRGEYRPSHAALVLRYRNTVQMLPVVYGRASDLVSLRDRLGRDLIVDRPFRRMTELDGIA